MKWKGILTTVLCSMLLLTGCNDVQIFVKEAPNYAVEVKSNELASDTFYVKNGTRFSKVYKPNGNVSGQAVRLSTSRVFYMLGDEPMIPVHYKGELVAYASAKASLNSIVLERFKDMNYSLGIYGGEIKEDGYYHFDASRSCVKGSEAESLFKRAASTEIRVVSIGGVPIAELIDEGSGIITGLGRDNYYQMEFYAGTYFYRQNFKADTHFLRAFEVYDYDSRFVTDTIHGYRCFNTPEDLKSGYYFINGTGLFLYHSYERGGTMAEEDFNEGYYENKTQMIANYSKEYKVSVPSAVKDMVISVNYESNNSSEITGYVVAPDGTGYDMDLDATKKLMNLSLATAQGGEWKVYVYPKNLDVKDVSVSKSDILEETVCYENTYEITEDETYKMFYAQILGDGDVYGSIIGPNGITYNFLENRNKDKQYRYLCYRLPYLKAGTYKIKIYYYQSNTEIGDVSLESYNGEQDEIIIIE